MNNEETKKEAPEAVRRIIEAMIDQALARCERLGISWEDFHQAMEEEEKVHPKASVGEVIELTFRRLAQAAN